MALLLLDMRLYKIYLSSLLNLAPFMDTSAMSPLTSNTKATIGSLPMDEIAFPPVPRVIRATLPSVPASHPLLAGNFSMHRMT